MNKFYFLIIKPGSSYVELRKQSKDFDNLIINSNDRNDISWTIRNVPDVEIYNLSKYKGIFVTGAHSSIVKGYKYLDGFKWIVDAAIKNRIPILGICFGHQLICKVLGGVVSRNPMGPEFGISKINLTINGIADAIFSGINKAKLDVYTSHVDNVSKLSSEFVQLAWNEHSMYQAVRYDNFIYGVQFHPEYTKDVMEFYIKKNWKLLEKDYKGGPLFKKTPEQLLNDMKELRKPKIIIKNFMKLAMSI